MIFCMIITVIFIVVSKCLIDKSVILSEKSYLKSLYSIIFFITHADYNNQCRKKYQTPYNTG